MIHFSVDDTIAVFRYLTENNCNSIFENPVLNYFKKLNDEYGFIVSMYCFYEKDGFNLSMCSDKYKNEFAENASWLKFGFHALTVQSNYKDCDAQEFKEHLILTVNELKRITSENSIVYDVRLGFGQGNFACIKAMKEVFNDFNVLYGVDDERIVYYLSEEENNQYLSTGEFYDKSIDITIKNCERRIECSDVFPQRVKEFCQSKLYPVFTHETRLGDEKIINYIEILCESGQEFIS